MSEINTQPGLIDAMDRVAQEILKTPRVKAGIKVIINSLDPQSAPQLVRTLMWKDADLFLSLIGAVPDLINGLLLGSKEVITQMKKIPPPLIAELVAKVIDKLDGEAVGSIIRGGADLYRQTGEVPDEPVKKSLTGFREGVKKGLTSGEKNETSFLLSVLQPFLKGQIRHLSQEAQKEDSHTSKLIKGLSEILAESLKENPEFITHIYKPLSESFRQAAGESNSD